MEHDDATDDRRARHVTPWLTAGLALIAAASFLTGPVAGVCGVLSGILLAQAVYAACRPDRAETVPPHFEDDVITPPGDAMPAVARQVDQPSCVERWVERTAGTAAAKRSR